MVDHLWGVDKSHYDPSGGTGQLVAEGFGFLTHKVGGDANDAQLNAWWNDAKPYRGRMLLGGYWVLYPGHGASAGDSFLARLDAQCPGWRDGPFILQLDCEKWNNDASTMPGVADIRACALRLRQLAPKLVPIVYAPRWAYGNSLSGLGFPLWSSAYTSATGAASAIYPGDRYSGWAAYSGIVPSIAQFSSTATAAGDNTTDVNAFKGTMTDLVSLLAPGWEIDMTQPADVWGYDGIKVQNGTATWKAGGTLGETYDTAVATKAAAARIESALSALASSVAAVRAALANPAPATVDVPALATALAPLIDSVSADELEHSLIAAFRDMATAAPVGNQTPAFTPHPEGGHWNVGGGNPGGGNATPVYDEAADELTRRLREERQPHIQSPGNGDPAAS